MLWNLYLRKDTVYLPTVAETDAGFFLDIEPVEVAAAGDIDALQHAVKQAIGRGNPKVPTPTRGAFPKPVVLKYANVKSWSAFAQSSSNWNIVEKNGLYQITRGRKHPEGGGWEPDPTSTEDFPAGIGIDEIARRVASSVQLAHRPGSAAGT